MPGRKDRALTGACWLDNSLGFILFVLIRYVKLRRHLECLLTCSAGTRA